MKKLESLKSELFEEKDLMTDSELIANQGGKEAATCNDVTGSCDVMHITITQGIDQPESRLNAATGQDQSIVDTSCSDETGEDVYANTIFGGGSGVGTPIEAFIEPSNPNSFSV